MHPRFVANVTLPLLYRRTWPRVRSALAEFEHVERGDPGEAAERSFRKAVDVARRAADRSPYLRALYAEHGVDASSIRTPEEFARLPVLTKRMVRDNIEDMVTEDAHRSDLVRGATGGSTGVPMPYYHDTEWWCRATAATYAADQWTGWRLGERAASVWGTPLHESRLRRLRRSLEERSRNFLFLSGFDLSGPRVDRMVGRLTKWRPRLVSGYASILAAVARRMRRSGTSLESPPCGVISSAEPLRSEERELVEEVFQAPVYDRYGCRELGFIGQECVEHRGMHIASEHVYVEVEAEGRAARPGQMGKILVTLLSNPSFPMVRYEVGDLAEATAAAPCPCGLGLPMIGRVDGRSLDVIHTADGSELTGVFFPHLMKEFPWVGAFQVVQDEDGHLDLRVVADGAEPAPEEREQMLSAVHRVMGRGVLVTLRMVEQLERTPAGKVRVTQSRYRDPTGEPRRLTAVGQPK